MPTRTLAECPACGRLYSKVVNEHCPRCAAATARHTAPTGGDD